jgi:hypothetical protein
MVKTLTNDQKEVTDYIKKNIDNQMLIFLSGEGEISYIICC